jgi:hypothetical protein
MSDSSSAGADSGGRSVGQKLKHGLHSKVLIPVATAVVSAAATYLIKKLPIVLEEKVLPKLRESGAPEPVQNVLEQASAQLGQFTGDSGGGDANGDRGSVAQDEAEQDQARSGDQEQERGQEEQPEQEQAAVSTGDSSDGGSSASDDDREEERRKREERRRERRRAVGDAA